jgi:hypothetical protein
MSAQGRVCCSLVNAPIKAFVSHASEDKPRFVLNFAERLRAVGIDAWLDKWEMSPGDSLIERIFEEGIGTADLFLVVLSKYSTEKRWVKEELDAGSVRRISGQCRLLPIILDEVQVPTSVAHLLWLSVKQLGIDGVVDEVQRVAYGRSEKPPLGEHPLYSRAASALPLLPDPADDFVLQRVLDVLRDAGPNRIQFSNEVQDDARANGISDSAFSETMHVLSKQGLIDAQEMAGGHRWWIRDVADRLWMEDAQRSGVDSEQVKQQLLVHLVNNAEDLRKVDLRGFGDLKYRWLVALLAELQAQGMLTYAVTVNGGIIIQSVSPIARRAVR